MQLLLNQIIMYIEIADVDFELLFYKILKYQMLQTTTMQTS